MAITFRNTFALLLGTTLSLASAHVDAKPPPSTAGFAWTEQQKLSLQSPMVGDLAGYGLGASGDVVIVGAPESDLKGNRSGMAQVFVRAAGTFSAAELLSPADAQADDQFGYALDVDGNIAAISAAADDDVKLNGGSVYVYDRSGGTFTLQQKLVPPTPTGTYFGGSLGVSGQTVIIGQELIGAFVHTRIGATWPLQQKLVPGDGGVGAHFGIAVDISGDTAIVGAYADPTKAVDGGSAYVFVRNGSVWTEQAKLYPSDPTVGQNFGFKVAIDGDTAIVGALGDSEKGQWAGAAYVFVRNGATWTQQQKLLASDPQVKAQFSWGLSLKGDRALIGAPEFKMDPVQSGSVYVFERSGASFVEVQKIKAGDAVPDQQFGWACVADGKTAIVGAPGDPQNGLVSGAAYVFDLKAESGDPCAAAADCPSGFCVDGVCCDTACGNGDATDCQACSVNAGASQNGTCAPLADGTICGGGVCNAGSCEMGMGGAGGSAGMGGAGGGAGMGGEGGGAGMGGAGGGAGMGGAGGGGTAPVEAGSCGCRVATNGEGGALLLVVLGSMLVLRRRTCRRGSSSGV